MKRTSFIWLMILLAVSIYAQERKKDDSSNTVKARKNVKTEGWKMPDLSKIKSHYETSFFLDDVIVKQRNYLIPDLDEKPSLEIQAIHQQARQLIYSPHRVWPRSIQSFSVADKTYAYRFVFLPQAIIVGNDKRERKFSPGIPTIGYFFDEDGDGKFETQYLGTEMSNYLPQRLKIPVPEMVKNPK